MNIYDISQEVFSCVVFPGDPAPKREVLSDINSGEICNLTAFSMCAHNGTHVDAPYHFINDGKKIDEIELSNLIGYAYVTYHEGTINENEIRMILKKAKEHSKECVSKILVGGKATLSLDAACVLAEQGIDLFGNESQTVGPEEAPLEVHKTLLKANIVLLEGIRLANVKEGVYMLFAAPICLGGADGAPCRAVLVEL